MLLVFRDGSARIQYGVAPQTARIPVGAFDLDLVLEAIRTTVVAPDGTGVADLHAGVVLPGSNAARRDA